VDWNEAARIRVLANQDYLDRLRLQPCERDYVERILARGVRREDLIGWLDDFRKSSGLGASAAVGGSSPKPAPRAREPKKAPAFFDDDDGWSMTPEASAPFIEHGLKARLLVAHLKHRWTEAECRWFLPLAPARRGRTFSAQTLFATRYIEVFLDHHPKRTWKAKGITWELVAAEFRRTPDAKGAKPKPWKPTGANVRFTYERAVERLRHEAVAYYKAHAGALPEIRRQNQRMAAWNARAEKKPA